MTRKEYRKLKDKGKELKKHGEKMEQGEKTDG